MYVIASLYDLFVGSWLKIVTFPYIECLTYISVVMRPLSCNWYFVSSWQVARVSSSGQCAATCSTPVGATGTAPSTSTTATSASTAASRSASKWAWGGKVGARYYKLPWPTSCLVLTTIIPLIFLMVQRSIVLERNKFHIILFTMSNAILFMKAFRYTTWKKKIQMYQTANIQICMKNCLNIKLNKTSEKMWFL